jgi:hypothetical protein
MIDWRRRVIVLLLGPGASLSAQVRAVVALGGMSDCTVEFPGVPMDRIKATAIEAACAALGLPPPSKQARRPLRGRRRPG